MEVVQVKAETRDHVSKSATKALRAEGKVPCVMYSKKGVKHFASVTQDLKELIYTPEFKLAEIDVDGATAKCILKDLQFHPVTDELLHVDFQELVEDHPVKVEIPVRFKGTSPGVRAGGKLIQKMRRVKIKTTPSLLVDHVTIDVSHLELGHSVRVRDIPEMDGVEIMNRPATPVGSVEIPRALRSAEAKAAAEGGDAAAPAE